MCMILSFIGAVSILITSPDNCNKRADIHLKASMQPYHLIPGHPSWSAIKSRSCMKANGKTVTAECLNMLKLSSFRQKIYSNPTLSSNLGQQNETVLHNVRRKISCLLIHHLADEWKLDVIFLTFPMKNHRTFCSYLCFFTGYTSC